ncbi:MAG: DUF3365 domain-containing protein [Alphaproteobacteria bacterium]|nr:DUF3365 domain-containing protein [Alphaproteobacteria bacterium]
MRRAIIGGLAGVAVFAATLAAGAETDLDARTAASKAVIKAFAGSLQAELKGAIKASGPVSAIEVCNEEAPAIAHRHAEDKGWEVGRTSLKYRNPDNAPDQWELTVLKSFEARKAAGEDPAQIDHAAFVMQDGKRVFRYMKAIPTAEICLNCHGGAEVKPEVAAKLADFYPDDRARGFHVGDIRGAFSIVQPAE